MATLKLVGVSFLNEDGTSRQGNFLEIFENYWTEGRDGDIAIELRPEANPHDPNAVAVFVSLPSWEDARQVGYLERDVAPAVRKALSADLVGVVRFSTMAAGNRGGISAKIGIGKKRVAPSV